MLVVTIEIHPNGETLHKRTIAVLTIGNVSKVYGERGDYDCELNMVTDHAYRLEPDNHAKHKGFLRSDGPIELLKRALRALTRG